MLLIWNFSQLKCGVDIMVQYAPWRCTLYSWTPFPFIIYIGFTSLHSLWISSNLSVRNAWKIWKKRTKKSHNPKNRDIEGYCGFKNLFSMFTLFRFNIIFFTTLELKICIPRLFASLRYELLFMRLIASVCYCSHFRFGELDWPASGSIRGQLGEASNPCQPHFKQFSGQLTSQLVKVSTIAHGR